MLRQISIRNRLFLLLVLPITVLTAIATAYAYSMVGASLARAEKSELQELFDNVLDTVDAQGVLGQTMGALVATLPPVQEALAAGDRDTLSELFRTGFNQLKNDYGIRQFQFHTPPATSFLRIHKLEKFGDDLSSFRHTVVEANNTRKPIRGPEVGVAGLGVRGIVPVSHQGKHVGTVEFGLSMGQAFLDEFAQKRNIQMVLTLDRRGTFETIASTFKADGFVAQPELSTALAGEPLFKTAKYEGKPVGLLLHAVEDYSGKPIGVLTLMRDRSAYADELSSFGLTLLMLSILGVSVSAGIVWFVSSSVTRPLCRTVDALQEIAQGDGDLSSRLPTEGRDEVSNLARAFNYFVDRVQSIVRDAVITAENMSHEVETLSKTAQHTNQSMQRQQGDTVQIATAMTQMSATVREVAENTALAAGSAREAATKAQDGQTVVNQTVSQINKLAEDMDRASVEVKRVDEDSTRIGSVLDVIRGIAEQTNLLALNAAIEAARAGDKGRGFAVVADEVRTLAQRTQEATQEIQGMIESLQQAVSATVNAMEGSREEAHQSVEQAVKANDALNAILLSIDAISGMSTQIATASEQQSSVAEEINRNINNITNVSESTLSDSQKTAEASRRIAELTAELSSIVSRFKNSA
jgi:methyl-accepting chemotaxis protein